MDNVKYGLGRGRGVVIDKRSIVQTGPHQGPIQKEQSSTVSAVGRMSNKLHNDKIFKTFVTERPYMALVGELAQSKVMPMNLVSATTGMASPYSHTTMGAVGRRLRENGMPTIFVVEKRKPFVFSHATTQETDTCSCRSIDRVDAALHQIMKSSTKSTQPMADERTLSISLILTPKVSNLKHRLAELH